MESGLSETMSTAYPVQVQVAASTSARLPAHTSQWSCVTMMSGTSALSASPSTQAVAHDLLHAGVDLGAGALHLELGRRECGQARDLRREVALVAATGGPVVAA